MPPDLDIYVVSDPRNRQTIEKFLTTYVSFEESEDRGDEELMILPLNTSDSQGGLDTWEWEPSKTLTYIVERGLQYPRRAFTVSLKTLDSSLEGATLAFTTDDRVIFGLSLDDEGAQPENLHRAKELIHEMARSYGARNAFIRVEMPPPLTGKTEQQDILVYSWKAE